MVDPRTVGGSASLGTDGGTITLVEGPAFCISSYGGDIRPGSPQGLFFLDTRYLSELCLRVNEHVPEPLGASAADPFSAVFVLRGQPRPGDADSELLVFRHRFVGRGMREDVVVRNYGYRPIECTLELDFDSDFADLFEVKQSRVEHLGDRQVANDPSSMVLRRELGDTRRATRVDFSAQPERISANHVTFEMSIEPHGQWSTCLLVTPIVNDTPAKPRFHCGRAVGPSIPVKRLRTWRESFPDLRTTHDGFRNLLEQSSEDLASLRLFDGDHPERVVVAAGAPWFLTLFGRDSLLTSWMTMMVDSGIALGTLQTLERLQGVDVDPRTEEEPGRIIHEMRFGESAELSLDRRGTRYYGTIDATPLFVMVLGELQRWGNDREAVDSLLPAADRALEWIEHFGDIDGDGYVEYKRKDRRHHRLENQSWKDSPDSIRFADGSPARAPVAPCEVQGYVYAAYMARAHFAEEHGDDELAGRLRARAAALKAAFNRDFWLEDRGWFAMALDCDNRPVDALASNMGHCLWTGIVDQEKAQLVADRLLSPEMFSGWGIRTLASSVVGFNPVSYHLGSVWPHDNSICAAGLMRYGLVEEAHRVMRGVIDAAAHFGNRLPELFAGVSRDEFQFPLSYPTACSPQAWAAASPLLMLRSILRFDPDLRNGALHLAPAIPEWMGRIRLDGISVLSDHLSIAAEGDHLEVLELPPELRIDPSPHPATI